MITYPIKDTDRFTVYDTTTSAPLNDGRGRPMTNNKWGSADLDQMVPNLADNIKWLINTKQDRPDHDEWTEKVDKAIVYDVANEEARTEFTVVALTQEEIDATTPAHYETTGGVKMGVEDRDQNAFANLLTLLNESGAPDTDMIAIKDIYGASHGMTLADFRTTVVAYGLYCYAQFQS